jgi:hypothetical protein
MTFNGNQHESPMRNLLYPFRREELLYLRVLALFFYVLDVYVLHSTHPYISSYGK